jgi:ComF family protein
MFCGFDSENLDMDLCSYCKDILPWLQDRCYKCGTQLKQHTEAMICEKCISNPPPYERLCALFTYEPPIRGLINRLKFNHQLYPAQLFATLMLEAINRWYSNKPLPNVIIPVPLHDKRYRQRGYNQAFEIASPIAAALKIPIDQSICQRIKYTVAQARLTRIDRLKNLESAFIANINNLDNVVLFDDVVTTGSTIRALSSALQTAGVKHIEVWAVCRG